MSARRSTRDQLLLAAFRKLQQTKNNIMNITQPPFLSRMRPSARSHKLVAPCQSKANARWKWAAALMCSAAVMISVSPAHAKSRAHARHQAKQCKTNYTQELARLRSMPLTAAERDARVNAAYDELAACLKTNQSLSMLPKPPVQAATTALPNRPAVRRGLSAAPSPTPVPQKKPWSSRSAPQTGTNL